MGAFASLFRRRPRLFSSVPLVLALFAAGCSGLFEGDGDGSAPSTPDAGDGIAVPSPEDPASPDPGDDVGLRTPSPCAAEPLGKRQLRLLSRAEYANAIADVLGIAAPNTDRIPVEPRVDGYDTDGNAAVVTPTHLDAYADLAKTVAVKALAERRSALVPCTTRDLACAKQVVRSTGRRLLRGTLDDATVSRFAALAESANTGGDFDAGLVLVVRALLQSPAFLYRHELGASAAGGYALTGAETASILAFTLWQTTPDDALLDAADRGELASAPGVRRHAERLLADPRAERGLLHFARGWLGTEGAAAAHTDLAVYPQFTQAVREAMRDEEKAFVREHFLGAERRFADLFETKTLHVNDPLAAYYGLARPGTGSAFTKVVAPSTTTRGGVLTLGTVLASHAHASETSPVKRGRFVRERMLCQPLPPPPPNLNTTPPGLDPSKTTRERFAAHTANVACSGCHKFIDGVGFGFESFDGAGAERRFEHGLPVDARGELLARESFDLATRESFDGPRALGYLLASSARAERCVATQFHRFTRGYAEADTCDARRLADQFMSVNGDLRELVLRTLTARSVRERRDDGAQP